MRFGHYSHRKTQKKVNHQGHPSASRKTGSVGSKEADNRPIAGLCATFVVCFSRRSSGRARIDFREPHQHSTPAGLDGLSPGPSRPQHSCDHGRTSAGRAICAAPAAGSSDFRGRALHVGFGQQGDARAVLANNRIVLLRFCRLWRRRCVSRVPRVVRRPAGWSQACAGSHIFFGVCLVCPEFLLARQQGAERSQALAVFRDCGICNSVRSALDSHG